MEQMKEMARALSRGDVRKAAEIGRQIRASDEETAYEVGEIIRQSVVKLLKNGDFESVGLVIELFSLPREIADSALTQGVLSIYYDGNRELLKRIKDKVVLSPSARKELVDYCGSWGREGDTTYMRSLFLAA